MVPLVATPACHREEDICAGSAHYGAAVGNLQLEGLQLRRQEHKMGDSSMTKPDAGPPQLLPDRKKEQQDEWQQTV